MDEDWLHRPIARRQTRESFPTRMVAKCPHPHLRLLGMAKAGKGYDELRNACQEGGDSGKLFDGVERVRAERVCRANCRHESRLVSAGVFSGRYELRGQGPRVKGKARVWFSDFMSTQMAWAQQRPKLRTRKCGYGKNLLVTFWQELLHQENAYSTTLASSKIQ